MPRLLKVMISFGGSSRRSENDIISVTLRQCMYIGIVGRRYPTHDEVVALL